VSAIERMRFAYDNAEGFSRDQRTQEAAATERRHAAYYAAIATAEALERIVTLLKAQRTMSLLPAPPPPAGQEVGP